MHTISAHDIARARPVLRRFNLLLLALLAGLLVGRSLTAVEGGHVFAAPAWDVKIESETDLIALPLPEHVVSSSLTN